MSKTPIDHTHPEFGSMIPEGLTTALLVDGDDRPVPVGEGIVHDPVLGPMRAKAVRMPEDMIAAVDVIEHPEGFSGVVRAAVAEWLQRHTGAEAEADDAVAALAVLTRVVAQHTGRRAA